MGGGGGGRQHGIILGRRMGIGGGQNKNSKEPTILFGALLSFLKT